MFAIQQCASLFEKVLPSLPHPHDGIILVNSNVAHAITQPDQTQMFEWIPKQSTIDQKRFLQFAQTAPNTR